MLRDHAHATGFPAASPAARCALLVLGLLLAAGAASGGQASPAAEPARPIRPADLSVLREVSEPRISPDGLWVAYTVQTSDTILDARSTDLWMTRWDSKQTLQLTYSKQSESHPRWSPDGKWLAFLSDRGEGDDPKTQVWLMDRAGGEPREVTELPGGVSDFAWSPDGKRLALIATDPDPDDAPTADDKPSGPDKKEGGEKATPKPIVIDRYRFKQDVSGYLLHLRDHLYAFDLATSKAELLTPATSMRRCPPGLPTVRASPSHRSGAATLTVTRTGTCS